ncbi:MAG: Cys-tRNA(Pro) deacylase [Oscillospiraceae bacterium]
MAEKKTNVMRILEKEKINYKSYEYDTSDDLIDAISVAKKLDQNINQVFKTLVTVGNSKNNFVFVVPAGSELDLKKAAKSVGEKNVEMIKVADINKTTGYIRGGCSPIGMKKSFSTVIHTSAIDFDTIIISGGKKGVQVELSPHALSNLVGSSFSDIIK